MSHREEKYCTKTNRTEHSGFPRRKPLSRSSSLWGEGEGSVQHQTPREDAQTATIVPTKQHIAKSSHFTWWCFFFKNQLFAEVKFPQPQFSYLCFALTATVKPGLFPFEGSGLSWCFWVVCVSYLKGGSLSCFTNAPLTSTPKVRCAWENICMYFASPWISGWK